MIKASNITKSFDSLKVLRGIDLQVAKGEVVAIMGASGAGKSTLLQILGTLLSADTGSILINGVDVCTLKGDALSKFRNQNIGFVFQDHHLLAEFTALENVMIPMLIGGESYVNAMLRASKLLDTVGLGERIKHKPSELSGGEQQRVAIARALANTPAVVFADEPSGNLDSATKDEIHGLFFKLRDTLGQTFILVTHDQDLANLCDRVIYLKDGLVEA